MRTEININFEQAIKEKKEHDEQREAEKKYYLTEFIDSNIELFDSTDFEFYSQMIDEPIERLLERKMAG